MIYFIGAGPGDPELMTIKSAKIMGQCQVVIYAGSLVNPEVLRYARAEAKIYDSSSMTLEEIIEVMKDADAKGWDVARIHTGDPAIYGAIREQMRLLDHYGIAYQVIPGVSSFTAAAAALKKELTLPEIAQTVILTRAEGRTPVPPGEKLSELAKHGATMAIFLSVHDIYNVVDQLKSGYPEDTPVAVVYKASWPDEIIIEGTLSDIAHKVVDAGIKKTAMILVGRFLGDAFQNSRLYDKTFSHGYRDSINTFLNGKEAYGKKNRLAVIALTKGGCEMARILGKKLNCDIYVNEKFAEDGEMVIKGDFRDFAHGIFEKYDGFVFIMATGIVVRAISGMVKDKRVDPAVVVMDEKGRFAISLLSGHIGGANELARQVADVIGAQPVITTATDINGYTAVDVLAKRHGLYIDNFKDLVAVNSAIANDEPIAFLCDGNMLKLIKSDDIKLPPSAFVVNMDDGSLRIPEGIKACVYITDKVVDCVFPHVILRPKDIYIGIGCKRGIPSGKIIDFIERAFEELALSPHSIAQIASGEMKKDEKGLYGVAEYFSVPISFLEKKKIADVENRFPVSEFVRKTVGVGSVARPCAYIISDGGKELGYYSGDGITLAVYKKA